MRGGMTFIRTIDGVDVSDPIGAAAGRVVFELYPVDLTCTAGASWLSR